MFIPYSPISIVANMPRRFYISMIGSIVKVIEWLLTLPKDAIIKAEVFKPKRTRQQSAYYWVLVTEIANVMRQNKSVIHNTMLRDYGQPMLINGERPYVFIPDTEEAELEVVRAEKYHLKPTSHVKQGKGDIDYRAYIPLLGSSQYNTREMSILLDGCIQEAKALEIETLTPEQIERMREEDRKLEERVRKKRGSK